MLINQLICRKTDTSRDLTCSASVVDVVLMVVVVLLRVLSGKKRLLSLGRCSRVAAHASLYM